MLSLIFVLLALKLAAASRCIQPNSLIAECGNLKAYVEVSEMTLKLEIDMHEGVLGSFPITIGGHKLDCRTFPKGSEDRSFISCFDMVYDMPLTLEANSSAVMLSDSRAPAAHEGPVKFAEVNDKFYVAVEFEFPDDDINIVPEDGLFLINLPEELNGGLHLQPDDKWKLFVIFFCAISALALLGIFVYGCRNRIRQNNAKPSPQSAVTATPPVRNDVKNDYDVENPYEVMDSDSDTTPQKPKHAA